MDRIEKVWRAAFYLALLTALVFATLPSAQAPQLQLGDKLQHMLAFAVLTALAALAYPRRSLWFIALWLAVFGAGIEVIQRIPALNRSSEFQDWIADMVAILVTLLICLAWRRWSARGRSAPDRAAPEH